MRAAISSRLPRLPGRSCRGLPDTRSAAYARMTFMSVLWAIAFAAVYFVAALSGSSLLWYPVSLLAVLGVPAVMGLIGALLVAAATGRTNRATRLSQLLPIVVGGLLVAAVFLVVTSGVRYAI